MSPAPLPDASRGLGASSHVPASCQHCGTPTLAGAAYCCAGCAEIHAFLRDQGLLRFYELAGGEIQTAPTQRDELRHAPYFELVESELQQQEGLTKLKLDIENLSCSACVWVCEQIFRRQEGAGSILVNPARGTIDLFVEPSFPLRHFVCELGRLGYRVGPRQHKARASDLTLRLGISAALAMNAMMFSISLYAGLADPTLAPLFEALIFGLATLSVLVGGSVFLKGAWRGLARGVLHLDLPIAVGLLLGYLGSLVGFALRQPQYVYFDTLTVFVCLMLLGRYLRERVLEQNRAALLSESDPLSLLVRRLRATDDGEVVEIVSVGEIRVGQQLLVSPGEVVPVAATTESTATLSLDWITGESDPREVDVGASVQAGASNAGTSAIVVTASSGFEASTVAELLATPRPADRYGEGQTPFEATISRYWAITVLVVASLGFVSWYAITRDPARGLSVAVAILVVTCPCAFGLSVPIAYEALLSGLRKQGLFVRSATFLERAAAVRRIVFDKTGTLTTGGLKVERIATHSEPTEKEWSLLYNLAARSRHPKAQPIVDVPPKHLRHFLPGLGVQEIGGVGMRLQTEGAVYELGRSTDSRTDVAFCRDGEPLVSFQLQEHLRSDARIELSKLNAQGYELWLLTGDTLARAKRTAAELGISETNVRANQSPANKEQLIAALDHADTLMIGDGLNDSLAVRIAHCSGTPGAERAFLAARTDFYLTGATLAPVGAALEAARLLRRVTGNAAKFAIVYNSLAVSLAMLGLMSPLLCAVVMPLSSVTSILLTLRGLRAPSHRQEPWKPLSYKYS